MGYVSLSSSVKKTAERWRYEKGRGITGDGRVQRERGGREEKLCMK